jgi:acetyltransferase-like isoleucine patch superfamily enzyme
LILEHDAIRRFRPIASCSSGRAAIEPPAFTRDRLARQIASSGYDIGEFTYGAPRIRDFGDGAGQLKIGRFCSIAEDVSIFIGGDHRMDWVTTFPLHLFLGSPGGTGRRRRSRTPCP